MSKSLEEWVSEVRAFHKDRKNWLIYVGLFLIGPLIELVKHWFYSTVLEWLKDSEGLVLVKNSILWLLAHPLFWGVVLVPVAFSLISVFIFIGSLRRDKSFAKVDKAPDPIAPKLTIHRAVYAAGLATEEPVTAQLQNLVRDGIVIKVDPTLGGLLPDDPAPGIPKRLDVEYTYGNDKKLYASRIERPGEIVRLALPEDTELIRLRQP